MDFGLHVSIAGGIDNAPQRAAAFGCETFQIFTRSPRGGAAPELTEELVKKFKNNCKQHGFKKFYIHTPYYINLASANPKIAEDSARIIREDLDRGSILGATAIMTHLGSSKDVTRKQAVKKIITGLKKTLKGYKGKTLLMLEIAAGSGNIMGDSFEEIAEVIKGLKGYKVGVCFDTAHAFASGYDLRTPAKVKKVFEDFDKKIGLAKLKLMHGNDSKSAFDSRVDRHANIGQGEIGLRGFATIINHPKLKKIDMIAETPEQEKMGKADIMILKGLRK